MSATASKPAIHSGESTPLSASDAAQLAAWYTRYALDRLWDDHRKFHPGVRSHLTAARAQHDAVATLLAPEHDQVVEQSPDAPPSKMPNAVGAPRSFASHSVQSIVAP